MMNKTLLSLGLATAMVVSTGAAVAAAQDDVATTSPTSVQVVDQDRDQIRDCDLYDGTAAQIRDRDRAVNGTGPLHEGTADGTGNQSGRSGR